MNLQTITIKEYFDRKGIKYKETNGELITKCFFCDKDDHFYASKETGQYDCKRCGEKGNLITLAKHLGNSIEDIKIATQIIASTRQNNQAKKSKLDPDLVVRCNSTLPESIKDYLNNRGITNDLLELYKIGFGNFYGRNWITIPIRSKDGNFSFLKLRQDPEDQDNDTKYKFYPTGSNAEIFGWECLKYNIDMIVICEGELDCIILQSYGIPAITSTAGAGTFKKEWIEELKNLKKIYVCFDKDDAGDKGVEKLIESLTENLPDTSIYRITLPERMIDGKDLTDYFTKYDGNPDELIYELSKKISGKKEHEISKFKPLNSNELIDILGLTIKKDEENKLVSFLCQLSAYTENAQFNISFNAPSSTGKSYIPTEIAKLFPSVDVFEIGYCSPTAFFHDNGKFNKERGGYELDLSRKILIFLDQPHAMLLERLRPLLSHDKKEIHLKITDKSQKGGLRTKNIYIKGYPAVVFCSAGLTIDEQEGTRFMLLSPETNQEKIREGIVEKIKLETDKDAYYSWLNADPDRLLLKERIEAIRDESIDNIKIPDPKMIENIFIGKRTILKPRHQRDIGRLMALIKVFALLNVWFRNKSGATIIANQDDVNDAVRIWEKISESQEYNLPPYAYNLYKEVIIPAYLEKNQTNLFEKSGLSRQDILNKHFQVHGRTLEMLRLRQQILPMLETAGLISQEPDKNDKRKILIYPMIGLTNSEDQNNIVNQTMG
jgi:5S rRNA maturation endonuclease (ribonuclease M5)